MGLDAQPALDHTRRMTRNHSRIGFAIPWIAVAIGGVIALDREGAEVHTLGLAALFIGASAVVIGDGASSARLLRILGGVCLGIGASLLWYPITQLISVPLAIGVPIEWMRLPQSLLAPFLILLGSTIVCMGNQVVGDVSRTIGVGSLAVVGGGLMAVTPFLYPADMPTSLVATLWPYWLVPILCVAAGIRLIAVGGGDRLGGLLIGLSVWDLGLFYLYQGGVTSAFSIAALAGMGCTFGAGVGTLLLQERQELRASEPEEIARQAD